MSNEAIADYYRMATAVLVSPHGLRNRMSAGDDSFTLVDIRSPMEFDAAHILGAINIPAYRDPDTPDYDAKDRIVSSFRALSADKEVIVYCYSSACMTGKKMGNLLATKGIYVKHLGIGWNEWRHDWTKWNHEHEWEICKVEDYIVVNGAVSDNRSKELVGSSPIQCEC